MLKEETQCFLLQKENLFLQTDTAFIEVGFVGSQRGAVNDRGGCNGQPLLHMKFEWASFVMNVLKECE